MTNQISLSGASDVRPKLSALIQDLCPNGVVFKTLGEVCIVQIAPMKLDKKEYQEQGLYPIVDQGQKFIVGYTDNVEALVPADDYVIFGDHTREIKYVDFTFAQGADGVKILKTKKEILPRFLYHVLKNTQIPSRGYNRHWTIAKDIEIPLPPLEIQKKIVECLDKFSALAAELQAELQKRRTQYEYYRTRLLTPPHADSTHNTTDDCNWEIKTLGEVCDFQNGFAFQSSKFTESGSPVLRITNIKDSQIDEDSIVYFEKNDYREDLTRYAVLPGRIVVAMSGATTGKVGMNRSERTYYLNQRVGMFIPNEKYLYNSYLFHFLSTQSEKLYYLAGGGAQPNLSTKAINELPISFPSLAEQKRIADLLDKFEALTTSLSEGIPAEQAAQQKRYEYYRDLLLTFDKR